MVKIKETNLLVHAIHDCHRGHHPRCAVLQEHRHPRALLVAPNASDPGGDADDLPAVRVLPERAGRADPVRGP